MEGDPVHQNIAKQFHCNLYLARLAEHGIDTTEDLMNLTAEAYWESAKLAYAIGKQLGKKVILMGTSTGGTLALQKEANMLLVAKLKPKLSLKDYKKSINYQPDDSLKLIWSATD